MKCTAFVLALASHAVHACDGEAVRVPIDVQDGVPVIPAKLGGASVSLILDTGQSIAISLPQSLAVPSLGVSRTGKSTVSANMIGTAVRSEQLEVKGLEIGGVSLGPVTGKVEVGEGVSLNDGGGAGTPSVIGRLGVVGLAALDGRAYSIDMGKRELVFHCERWVPAREKVVAPLKRTKVGLEMQVPLGKGVGTFVVDSAASVNVIQSRAAARLFGRAFCQGKRGPTEASAETCGVVRIKSLGGHSVTVTNMGDGVPFDGLLGIDFLTKYVLASTAKDGGFIAKR